MLLEDRISWAIHYLDLSVYTNTSGAWGNAPSSGVLIVVEYAKSHKEVHMGMDYYYMDSTPSGNISGYLEIDKTYYSFLSEANIKIGTWTDIVTWNAVHKNIFGV